METLLVAINAKFSHTNLAVRYLSHTLVAAGLPARICEYTINQPTREILTDLVRRRPDAVLFSCYLWNIDYVRRIGADLRLLCPEASILLGGPEVSFDSEELLEKLPWADGIFAGEGEPLVAAVLRKAHPKGVFRAASFTDLDALAFPYDDLSALQNRVLYYESSRGCPFGCAYCLSSADRTTRFRALPLVFADLQRFLDADVMQVKFVDRTFNVNSPRALKIWRFLAAHDNGHTCFQMEIGGDLLDQEALDFLKTVRPGLFQFEVGVQSTDSNTLTEICRKTDLQTLFRNVRAVKAAGNLHQHLDLIAGLPLEGFAQFAKSYDEVFALAPEQLQLGFLKLLRGSTLYAKRAAYGLVHSETPPYEILSTPQLSFGELARLKCVEEMTEAYYNSGRFAHTLDYLLTLCPSPFWALLALGESMPSGSLGKYAYYDRLYEFCVSKGGDPMRCRWLLKYDLCLHERPRKLPACCADTLPSAEARKALLSAEARKALLSAEARKALPSAEARKALLSAEARKALPSAEARKSPAAPRLPGELHLEVFPFDVTTPEGLPGSVTLLFDYGQRDLLGHAACQKLDSTAE